MSDKDEFQLRKTVSKLNMSDWTAALDKKLQECVVQSYFNFDLVCAEVNQKAREDAVAANDPIGARERFTTEHMRLRWSYIHLLVSTAKNHPPLLILFYCSAKLAKNRPIIHWTGKSRGSHPSR